MITKLLFNENQMISVFIALNLISIPSVVLDTSCGHAFKSFSHGLCAYLSNSKMTYCDAVKACAQNNGRFVSNYDNLVTILLSETETDKNGNSYYIGLSVFVNNIDPTKRKLIWEDNQEDTSTILFDFPEKNCAIYSFFSGKETIKGSDCTELNYYICEEVVYQAKKVFYPQATSSVWTNKNVMNICAMSREVETKNSDRHCSLLCYYMTNCRSFWYNKNGECKYSHLSNIAASFDDSQSWKLYTTKEETLNRKRWTPFIRRISNSLDFGVGWSKYKEGFGDDNGNFWLGLEKMHLATQMNTAARFYFTDWDNSVYYSTYTSFNISHEDFKYAILYSGYMGTLCDGFYPYMNGMYFTTIDADNDRDPVRNSALLYKGGWWYGLGHAGILTGKYYTEQEVNAGTPIPFATGITFKCFNSKGFYYSVKRVEAKFLSDYVNEK